MAKILFTRFPLESRLGGAEIQTISLMDGLVKRSNNVFFLGSCPTLLKLCGGRGIPAMWLDIGPPPVTKWTAFSFLWRRWFMRRKLVRALKNFPDLGAIVMLSLSEKLLLTPLALKAGIPVFWIEHDRVGRWLAKNPWLSQLLELSKSVTTIVVSDLSAKIYADLGWDPGRVIAIPNGVDIGRFGSVIRRRPIPGIVAVGTVARLSPEKGVDLLIQAIRSQENMSLVIVGTGRDEQKIRKMIATAPSIRLISDSTDLAPFFASLDVFVLPSREHDPFGLVVAEAMTIGIPCVVTDACGIAGYLKNGENAVIVPAGDVDALRNGITSLSDPDRRTRIGEEGRTFARLNLSSQKMTERYDTLLR